ncbi:MBG domain-containing protein, partial [Adlercreutzia equolifaciens]|uniref:MBG domain-containing protein n=1 Tax=Adlercreutzia equolifaciens TaxID=446660 RepID=UPI003AF85D2F
LPSAGGSEDVEVQYWQNGRFPWESGSWKTTTVATITNDGNGVYTIKYTNNHVYGDALQLQFVEITCEKATYGVKYDLNGGTGQISDSNTYDVVDNTTAVVTNRMPEAPEDQIFLGWKIKGNESGPIYAVGDALDFTNNDIFEYVGDGDSERDGYLTLVAQYADDIAYGSSRPVNVKYFFENEAGEFVEDETMRTTVQGVAGKQLSMLQYDQAMTHGGYEYTFDASISKTTITVTSNNAIELRYTLERVDYTYSADEGGSVYPTSERVIAQKEGAAQGSVATADSGYKFDGWYVNVDSGDVKITDENAVDYNVKLSDGGTKLIPQRHNGKYEGGTFTAKFVQKQGIFRYNLVLPGATWSNGAPTDFTQDGNFWVDPVKYANPDEITVTNEVPACVDYTFLGWFDKDRGEGASIRPANSTFVFPEKYDSDTYTLDALWASIKAEPKTVTYDGDKHAVDAAEVLYNNNGLPEEDLADVQNLVSVVSIQYSKSEDGGYSAAIPTWKDAGTYTVYIKATLNVGGQAVEVKDSTTLTIDKRDVTLKSADLTKPWDGTPLANGTTPLETESGWVAGQGATYEFTGSRTDVGTSEGGNTFDYTLNEGTDANNYNIKAEFGDITITDRGEEAAYDVTVTANSKKETYDGGEKSVSGFQGETGQGVPVVANGITYYVTGLTSEASGTDVADSVPEIEVKGLEGMKVVDADGTDVTAQFDVTIVPGSLTIDKRDVTITTDSSVKVYDGTELVAGGDIIGLVDGDAVFEVIGSQISVGSSRNTYSLDWSDGKDSNYTVSETLGTLTVVPQSINPNDPKDPDPNDPDQPVYSGVEVNAPADVPYNGADQTWVPVVTDAEGNSVDPSNYDVTYSTDDRTNVTGVITVTITGKGNYGGTVTREYRITPREYTVTTESAAKVYDGAPLTEGGITVSGIVEGETYGAAATGSQTEVGTSDNTYDLTFAGEGNEYTAKASNYALAENGETLGTLTVVPQSIDPTDPPEPDPDNPGEPVYSNASVDSPTNVPYDGAVHQWAPTVTDGQGNVLTPGEDYTVDYSTEDFTNVTGVITATITGKGNYGGTVTREYQITPREIVLTIDDQTKVAGAADPTFTSDYTGVIGDELAGWTGAFVRDAGEAAGTYTIHAGDMALADNPSTGFLASNYTLRVVEGTLTITAAPVTPPGGGDNPGGGTPDGTTPGGGTPGGTAAPTAVTDDGAAIEDDATPLAVTGETIDDEGTPLSSGAKAHVDCWVHWLMIVGLIVSAIYFGGVAIRRRMFSSQLQSFEDDVLGNNANNTTNA